MAKKSVKIAVTYAEAVKELEQILENLRGGKVEINDLATTVKRANVLVEECRRQLSLTRDDVLGWKADTPIEDVLLSAWNWEKNLRTKV